MDNPTPLSFVQSVDVSLPAKMARSKAQRHRRHWQSLPFTNSTTKIHGFRQEYLIHFDDKRINASYPHFSFSFNDRRFSLLCLIPANSYALCLNEYRDLVTAL